MGIAIGSLIFLLFTWWLFYRRGAKVAEKRILKNKITAEATSARGSGRKAELSGSGTGLARVELGDDTMEERNLVGGGDAKAPAELVGSDGETGLERAELAESTRMLSEELDDTSPQPTSTEKGSTSVVGIERAVLPIVSELEGSSPAQAAEDSQSGSGVVRSPTVSMMISPTLGEVGHEID